MLKLFVKKWAFILVIAFFSLVIGARTSLVFFQLFFWFLVVTVALSFFWLIISFYGTKLKIRRYMPAKIAQGQELKVELLIENKGFLPVFNLVAVDMLPRELGTEKEGRLLFDCLVAESTLRTEYSCFCSRRGDFRIGPVSLYFFDPLGLFFLKKVIPIYSSVIVYPKTFRIRKLPSLLLKGVAPWYAIEAARVSGEEDEFYGVREYASGDPIKMIHWLSTARHNKLIVRQFQQQSFYRATIIFNLEKEKNFGEGEEKVGEYIIRIAASLSQYLLEKNISLEIIAHTEKINHLASNKGSEHLENIFRFLATAQAESKVSLGEIFEEFSRYIPDYSTVIAIMLDKDWKHIASLLPLEKRNVVLIPVILLSSTFVHDFDAGEVIQDVKIKLSKVFHLAPILISRQDNLEEAFLTY